MKYLGWIIAFLLLAVCVLNQVTISNYKEAISDYKKATAIWEQMFYECKGWK